MIKTKRYFFPKISNRSFFPSKWNIWIPSIQHYHQQTTFEFECHNRIQINKWYFVPIKHTSHMCVCLVNEMSGKLYNRYLIVINWSNGVCGGSVKNGHNSVQFINLKNQISSIAFNLLINLFVCCSFHIRLTPIQCLLKLISSERHHICLQYKRIFTFMQSSVLFLLLFLFVMNLLKMLRMNDKNIASLPAVRSVGS